MPIIPALGRLKKEDHELAANLGHIIKKYNQKKVHKNTKKFFHTLVAFIITLKLKVLHILFPYGQYPQKVFDLFQLCDTLD
jgi:hypothetical protein